MTAPGTAAGANVDDVDRAPLLGDLDEAQLAGAGVERDRLVVHAAGHAAAGLIGQRGARGLGRPVDDVRHRRRRRPHRLHDGSPSGLRRRRSPRRDGIRRPIGRNRQPVAGLGSLGRLARGVTADRFRLGRAGRAGRSHIDCMCVRVRPRVYGRYGGFRPSSFLPCPTRPRAAGGRERAASRPTWTARTPAPSGCRRRPGCCAAARGCAPTTRTTRRRAYPAPPQLPALLAAVREPLADQVLARRGSPRSRPGRPRAAQPVALPLQAAVDRPPQDGRPLRPQLRRRRPCRARPAGSRR